MKKICEINGIRFFDARPDRFCNPRVAVHWTDFLTAIELAAVSADTIETNAGN